MKDKASILATDSYEAKFKYNGDIARRYNERRTNESKWIKEQEIFSSILSAFPESSCLVDVPIGTGRFISFYKKYKLRCEGIDISEDMLNEARKVAVSHQYAMSFMQGSADKLPQADSACDYVICARLLNWVPFPTLEAMVREFDRVSRAGLVLEIRVSSELDGNTLAETPRKNYISRTARAISKMVKAILKGKPTTFYLHDSDMINRLFDSLGLDIVNAHTVDNAIKQDQGLQTHLNIYELCKQEIK